MKSNEVVDKLGAHNSLVMVIDNNSRVVYSIKSIEHETHNDADGSETIWIKVEEI